MSLHLNRRLSVLALAALLLVAVPPAHAVNKDILQLQVQMQALQDAIARLQQTNDESMGALKSLVQQTADSVSKMSDTVNAMGLREHNQQDAFATKSDQLSGQIQSLNDSLDELKARLDRMQKALTEIQGQQQSANAMLSNLPGASGAGAPGNAPSAAPPPDSAPAPSDAAPASAPPAAAGGDGNPFSTAVAQPVGGQPVGAPPAAAAAPLPLADMYRSAYSDYMAAKYPLATSEFSDLIKAYPSDNLSGNAWFYIAEMDLRAKKPTAAVKAYDRLLDNYPDNTKVPAAHLHKAEAMLSMHQNEAATRELRGLIQRFPNSPEAAQARLRLAALRH